MNKRIIYTLVVLGTSWMWSSCNNDGNADRQQGSTERTVTVSVASVEQEVVTGHQGFPATVVPLNETELRAEVSGYITNIYVADGASVTKGQRLYEIDRTRYAAEVEQAKANLSIAESNYERVGTDVKRYRRLSEQDAIAKQTLDYAETDLNNQAAQVQAAKAALTTANMNLQRSVIYAPFAGVVGISQVRNGALVSAGTTLLNTLSSTNPIAVEFQINEREIERIKELQHNKSTTAIQLRLPNGTIYDESGYISTMDRAVDRATGTLRVRATFNNATDKLRAGMNLALSLAETSAQEEIVIPQRAVIEQLGVYNVYTVSDSSTAVYNEVTLGIRVDDKIVIKKGLSAGQDVVVNGVNNVSEGDKLKIENE